MASLVALALSACAADEPDVHGAENTAGDDAIGVARSGLSLSELAAMVGCTTAGTEGLSGQLIEEMLCLSEGRLVRFDHPSIELTSSRVHPYLSPAGRDMIMRVADRTTVRLNSTLRTIAEQYVLYDGCSVAAEPGRSNHETGRAIDVDNYASIGSILTSEGFTHPLPDSDPVHYEAPGDDLRNLSVMSFQRIWNVNHPEDRIAEDGVTGPMTLGRLERSPAEGFPMGGTCGSTPPPPTPPPPTPPPPTPPPPPPTPPPPTPPTPPPPTPPTPPPSADAGPTRDAGTRDTGPAAPPSTPDGGASLRPLSTDDGCSCRAAGSRRDDDDRAWPALIALAVTGIAITSRRRYASRRART